MNLKQMITWQQWEGMLEERTRECDALQSALSSLQAKHDRAIKALQEIAGESAGLVDEIIYAREQQKIKIDSAPMEDTFRRFRNKARQALADEVTDER